MEEQIEKAIEEFRIRENVGYKWIMNERLMMINMAFDQGDKSRIKSALQTTFSMLTPYINSRFKKCRCKKKISELSNIRDKKDFIQEAHEVYCVLLKIMHSHNMLFSEVPITLG